MSRDETLAIYDAKAGDYAAMSESLSEFRELEAFAAALPEGARVLDLGCGPGFYAGWLAQQGFVVEACDGSAEMVVLAKRQDGVAARQARFDELDAQAAYDGVWANFSLLHAPKAEMGALLSRIRRAGRDNMVFHIGMKLGEGEGPDAIGRFYAYYSEGELEGMLNDAGFKVRERRRGRGKGLSGEMADHVTMLCHG
ncbi:methyltransferase domain-containing protein [Rhodobacteraceae bacterium D3-12]|nr:methyltransferase domain-containing protein [Rhodobacteraceae bacterium D3-12]